MTAGIVSPWRSSRAFVICAGASGHFVTVGSLVIFTTALFAILIGILAGIYLEDGAEEPADERSKRVNNLAGVPSILLSMAHGIFVHLGNPNRWFSFLPEGVREVGAHLFGQSILTAGITPLLILPVVIVATREAVCGVPREMRQGALAVGATKWQTTQHHVLPYAPGVVTGVIIAFPPWVKLRRRRS